MSGPITISAVERDLLYHRILIHLSGIDRVWSAAAEDRDFEEADRIGRQFSDELQLILNDLGWGEERGEGPVELTSSPDVVRRTALLLRDLAKAEDADERVEREEMKAAEEENRRVRELCGRLLAALDEAPAVSGGAG